MVEAGAGAAERVAEGDRAAVDVEPLLVDPQLAGAGEDLGGEGLVQLDQVDLVEREAGGGEGAGDRLDRADAHVGGVDAGDAEGDDPGERLGAELPRRPPRRRSAVQAAPSLRVEALPAVTVPPSRKTGRSFAIFSSEASGARALVGLDE